MRGVIPVTVTALAFACSASAAYNLVREYSGSNFFEGWEFYGNYDNLTNGTSQLEDLLTSKMNLMFWSGDVNWVTEANATQAKLAYVDGAGHAIIKVDNTSSVPYNEKRDTVRFLTSTVPLRHCAAQSLFGRSGACRHLELELVVYVQRLTLHISPGSYIHH